MVSCLLNNGIIANNRIINNQTFSLAIVWSFGHWILIIIWLLVISYLAALLIPYLSSEYYNQPDYQAEEKSDTETGN